jgi:hypothetical protein
LDLSATIKGLGALTLFVEETSPVTTFHREVLGLRTVFENDVSTVFDLGGTMRNVLAVTAAAEVVAPLGQRCSGPRLGCCSACGSKTWTLSAESCRSGTSSCSTDPSIGPGTSAPPPSRTLLVPSGRSRRTCASGRRSGRGTVESVTAARSVPSKAR